MAITLTFHKYLAKCRCPVLQDENQPTSVDNITGQWPYSKSGESKHQ